MQHVNFLVADMRRWVGFHVEVLGFGISDWIGDGACWLHVDADHHVLAGMVKPAPHFHHLALELHDFAAMRVALDHLGQHGRWVTWGPGRHTMARNLFSYVRMCEEECFVELFCDMEVLRQGHEPRQWPDDVRSSNAWGTLPPRTYFRFDDEAMRIEQRAAREPRQGVRAGMRADPPATRCRSHRTAAPPSCRARPGTTSATSW